MLEALSEPFAVDGRDLYVTGSIGIDTVETPFRSNDLPTGILTRNNRPEYGAVYRRAAAARKGAA